MKQKFQITIESENEGNDRYKLKKEYNRQVMMTDQEFLDIVGSILDFINQANIEDFVEQK